MRLVIFDMDGTLVDTALATLRAFEQVTAAHTVEMPDSRLIRQTIGVAAPMFYDQLFPTLPAALVRQLGAEIEAVENEETGRLGARMIFDGIWDVLSELERCGWTLFLASTGSCEHVAAVLNATGLGSFFSRIDCNEPDKREMVSRMLTGTEVAAMIGDTAKDADAAHANGIAAIGAGYGYCGTDRYARKVCLKDHGDRTSPVELCL